MVEEILKTLKVKGTYQFLVCVEYVKLLGEDKCSE
jgi:hypothetical protein